MDSNIHIINIDRLCKKNTNKIIKKYRNKIVDYSFFSLNEVTISHLIKKIMYYETYFSILEGYEILNISHLSEEIIEKINGIEDKKYYLFKYDDKNSTTFIQKIYDSNSGEKITFDLINSFVYLLHSLYILNENNICFFNISPENIIYIEKNRENPLWSNFSLSLDLNKLDYTYISHILNKLECFTYQPFEIHLLFYFVKHKLITISYSFIEDFCDKFINNLSILELFPDSFKMSYKEKCVEMLQKYINLPRKEIIKDILERNDKWDIYGLSLIYIKLFSSVCKVFSLKDTFINKMLVFLSQNLHPDSDKRYTITETSYAFHKFIKENKSWCFIDNLDNNKLTKLFEELAK